MSVSGEKVLLKILSGLLLVIFNLYLFHIHTPYIHIILLSLCGAFVIGVSFPFTTLFILTNYAIYNMFYSSDDELVSMTRFVVYQIIFCGCGLLLIWLIIMK